MGAEGKAAKLLRLIEAYYASTRVKIRGSGGEVRVGDSLSFEMRSGVRHRCAISPFLFYSFIEWILGQALQGYTGVQVGTIAHVSDLDIMLQGELQGLFKAVNRHATAVSVHINVSKTKAMTALIADEQRQVAMLEGELVAATCAYTRAIDRSSRAGFRSILVLTSLANTRAGLSERRFPPAPIRTPEW